MRFPKIKNKLNPRYVIDCAKTFVYLVEIGKIPLDNPCIKMHYIHTCKGFNKSAAWLFTGKKEIE